MIEVIMYGAFGMRQSYMLMLLKALLILVMAPSLVCPDYQIIGRPL